jgi:hypothetical protein
MTVLASASSNLTDPPTIAPFYHTNDDDICIPCAFIISAVGAEFSLNYLLGKAF